MFDIPFSYGRTLIVCKYLFQGKRKYSTCDLKCTYCIFTLWSRFITVTSITAIQCSIIPYQKTIEMVGEIALLNTRLLLDKPIVHSNNWNNTYESIDETMIFSKYLNIWNWKSSRYCLRCLADKVRTFLLVCKDWFLGTLYQ